MPSFSLVIKHDGVVDDSTGSRATEQVYKRIPEDAVKGIHVHGVLSYEVTLIVEVPEDNERWVGRELRNWFGEVVAIDPPYPAWSLLLFRPIPETEAANYDRYRGIMRGLT